MTDIPIESGSASMSMADVNMMEKGASSRDQSETMVDLSEQSGSMPAVDEVRAAVPPTRRNRKKWALLCLAPLAVLVIVAVIVSVSLSSNDSNKAGSSSNQNNNNSNNPQQPSTPSAPAPSPPTTPNNNTPPTAPRASFQEIVAWLEQESISNPQALQTAETPQNLAAHWLAETDPAQVPLPTASIDDPGTSEGYMYMIRYVMALIYFQMNGENWPAQLGFLTESFVCLWNGFSLTAGGTVGSYERGGLRCDSDTGLPVVLDLGKKSVIYFYNVLRVAAEDLIPRAVFSILTHICSRVCGYYRIQQLGGRDPHRTWVDRHVGLSRFGV